MDKDSEPVIEPGKTGIPYIFADSGLATFIDESSNAYIVTKK
jgi:hypothetical protein